MRNLIVTLVTDNAGIQEQTAAEMLQTPDSHLVKKNITIREIIDAPTTFSRSLWAPKKNDFSNLGWMLQEGKHRQRQSKHMRSPEVLVHKPP